MQKWNRCMWALGVALVLSLTSAWGCSDDPAASTTSCSTDTDCTFGTVCAFPSGSSGRSCIDTVPCEYCTPDQVCLRTPEDPDGYCSVAECTTDTDCAAKPGTTCQLGLCTAGGSGTCTTDDDCADGQECNLAGQCEAAPTCADDTECGPGEICTDSTCVDGCSDAKPCPTGETCNAQSQCEATQTCTPGSCPAGQACDATTMQCAPITSCDQVTCEANLFCNPTTFACEAGCTAAECEANGQVCDGETGQCVTDNCIGEDPMQCAGNTERPLWDPVKCFCAECISDSDCDTAAGETCNAGGQCFACETACDSNTPGTCGAGTPYCINDCCVECVGAADCSGGQLCLDGFCGEAPNCTEDPTVCPTGYECNASGECVAPTGGQSCDPQDPASCPQGTFCMPDSSGSGTASCQSPGGGLGCGLCNPDCTCPNGACNGFACECVFDPIDIIGGGSGQCPTGQSCVPLDFSGGGGAMCLPFSF